MMLSDFFRSVTFRIIFFNLLVFSFTLLAFFYFLDRFQLHYLMARTDEDLETAVLVVTGQMNMSIAETPREELVDTLDQVSAAHGVARGFIRILDEHGHEYVSSGLYFWPDVDNHPIPELLAETPTVWETTTFQQGPTRIMYYLFPEGQVLQVGHRLTEMNAVLARTRVFSGTALIVMLLLGGTLSWFVTFGALKGIRRIGRAAATIREQGKLDYRVPAKTGSLETDRLAETFNNMLVRIQSLVTNLRYVMDNIAHDIKTPVTRMRGVAESSLVSEDCKDADLCGHVLEECDHILNLVNTLLQITAAESGLYQWDIRVLDLAEMVREGCDLFQPIFEEKQLEVTQDIPDRLEIPIDGRVIQRVVANLVDNAVKYSEPGGRIHISLAQKEGKVYLEVADTGIGIPQSELPLIFDRFYRSDHSRSRPGNGLGLSFCKATLEGMGGSIYAKNRSVQGAIFTVELPSSPKI